MIILNIYDWRNRIGSVLITLILLVGPYAAPAFAQGELETTHYDLYSSIAGRLMCLCGCGSNIKNCPHKDCGFANPVKDEIKQFVKQGQSNEQIVSYFVEKYGEKILTAPTKQGFNIVGYILPGVLIIMVGGLISWVLIRWTSQRAAQDSTEEYPTGINSDDNDASYNERLQHELEDYDKD